MRTYFVTEKHDWFQATFENLNRCLGARRLVLPGPSLGNRRWETLLRMASTQVMQVFPLMRTILCDQEQVLLVCTAAWYSALLSGLIARLLGKHPLVYLCNFYLHSMGNRRVVQITLSWLLAQQVGILVQSPNEIEFFRALAPNVKLDYYPLCLGNPVEPMGECAPADYVFAGGYTNRDYDTLMRVARRLESQRFIIVRSPANQLPKSIPGNVEVLTDIPANQFKALMGASMLVVLPLKQNVGSSGQMVALSAMQMAKPVIYADFPAVSQYFRDGYSGIAYTPRDENDLERKIMIAVTDDAMRRRLGAHARVEWQERFVRDRFEQALIDGVIEFVALSKQSA